MHSSTYHGLKEDNNSNQDHTFLIHELDRNTRDKFGPDTSPDNFPDVNLEDTPLYDMY